jgi:hypothetical protein
MSMSNASELALLNLLFKNVAWADVGDAAVQDGGLKLKCSDLREQAQ